MCAGLGKWRLKHYLYSRNMLFIKMRKWVYFMHFLGLCTQLIHFSYYDCENSCTLYFIIIIIMKSEVWPIYHCLGLGHEIMVSAVSICIFLLNGYIFSKLCLILLAQYVTTGGSSDRKWCPLSTTSISGMNLKEFCQFLTLRPDKMTTKYEYSTPNSNHGVCALFCCVVGRYRHSSVLLHTWLPNAKGEYLKYMGIYVSWIHQELPI